jgi:hypothetical protein
MPVFTLRNGMACRLRNKDEWTKYRYKVGCGQKEFLVQMDDTNNGVKPPTITASIARILFTTLSSTHKEDSIIMTRIAIQDYDYEELLTAILDKEELKVLVKIVEAKVKRVRLYQHRCAAEGEFYRYHHSEGYGYKPLFFSFTELKGEINRIWRKVTETQTS